MSKEVSSKSATIVRDSKSGQLVTVKGAGALRGKMWISKTVDLTKPIVGPSPSGKWAVKGSKASANTAAKKTSTETKTAKR